MKTRLLPLLFVLLGCVGPVHAQDTMPTTVLADRVLIGPEQFIPRVLDHPTSLTLIVPAGQVVEAPADDTFDYIEVAGSLNVSHFHDTWLRFKTLVVLPGGVLNVGFKDASGNFCIPPNVHVRLTVRDIPIDTQRDPFQWGNGIVNFGKWYQCGAERTSFVPLRVGATEGAKGATVLTLEQSPVGWQVGDALAITNTVAGQAQEATLHIAKIAGAQVTLTTPLGHDHLVILRQDGQVVLTARVANLTRNIVVESENPSGTRGHTAIIGHDAVAQISDSEFNGLGRTRNVPLDNTSADQLHKGTNQIAKYALHFHHVMMGLGSYASNNVLNGGEKWGLVVHASHDIVVDRNVVINFKGAGVVTEDGYEVRNTFTHNLVAFIYGNHNGDPQISRDNDTNHCPGCEGSAFWFRGLQDTIIGNEGWDSHVGLNVITINQIAAMYPSVPGGMPDTKFDRLKAFPVAFKDNIGAANIIHGEEYWGPPACFLNERTIAANNNGAQFFTGLADPAFPCLIDVTLVAQDGSPAVGIKAASAYTSALFVNGGYIGGNSLGIAEGGANGFISLKNVTFQNVRNIPMGRPPALNFTNVKYLALGSHPLHTISYGLAAVWNGVLPLPDQGDSHWSSQRGSRAILIDHQGIPGNNFQLFYNQQLASLPVWPSFMWPDRDRLGSPEAGITMGEAWAKYGMAYEGEALADADVVTLPGMDIGLARAGSVSTLGTPRAIITLPTMRARAELALDGNGPYLPLFGLMTGAADPSYPNFTASIDGGPWFVIGQRGDVHPDVRDYAVRTPSALTNGTHQIRTARAGAEQLAASAMTFSYFVNEVGGGGGGVVTTPNRAPIGVFDVIGSDNTLYGWAFDRDTPTVSVPVQIYVDGRAGAGGVLVGSGTPMARLDVSTFVGATGLFGFSFSIPTNLRDGKAHTYFAYGLDTSVAGVSTLLTGSPKTFTVVAVQPPVDCVVGPWTTVSSSIADSPTVTAGTVQTRTETTTVQQRRTIVTPPANGGAACPLN